MVFKIKNLNNSTFIKGGLFSLFSFFNKGLNFLLLLVIAKYLNPDDYGQLNLFTTLVTLLGFFICLGSEGYISIAYFKNKEDGFKKAFSTVLLIPVCVFLSLSLTLLIIGIRRDSFLDVPFPFPYFALTYVFINVYINICLDYFRVQEKIIKYGLISCSYAVLNFLLTVIFIIQFQTSWSGRVYAMILCAGLYLVIALYIFFKDKLFSLYACSKQSLKNILHWGLPLIPHHASIWIKQGCDRYLINSFFSAYQVGIFSFALNLSNIMTMIGVAFNASNSVDIYKTLSSLTIDIYKIRNYIKKMLIVYVVILGAIVLGATFIVPMLLPEYTSSIKYFYVLLPCSYLQCVYFLYCNFLFYYGENKKVMIITFGSSVFHLLLSILFTRYSLVVTAAIYSISQMSIILFVRYSVKKVLDTNISGYKSNWIL